MPVVLVLRARPDRGALVNPAAPAVLARVATTEVDLPRARHGEVIGMALRPVVHRVRRPVLGDRAEARAGPAIARAGRPAVVGRLDPVMVLQPGVPMVPAGQPAGAPAALGQVALRRVDPSAMTDHQDAAELQLVVQVVTARRRVALGRQTGRRRVSVDHLADRRVTLTVLRAGVRRDGRLATTGMGSAAAPARRAVLDHPVQASNADLTGEMALVAHRVTARLGLLVAPEPRRVRADRPPAAPLVARGVPVDSTMVARVGRAAAAAGQAEVPAETVVMPVRLGARVAMDVPHALAIETYVRLVDPVTVGPRARSKIRAWRSAAPTSDEPLVPGLAAWPARARPKCVSLAHLAATSIEAVRHEIWVIPGSMRVPFAVRHRERSRAPVRYRLGGRWPNPNTSVVAPDDFQQRSSASWTRSSARNVRHAWPSV